MSRGVSESAALAEAGARHSASLWTLSGTAAPPERGAPPRASHVSPRTQGWRAEARPRRHTLTPKTARSQHAGAPATLKTALRLPHGAAAAERARYMAGAGEAAVGLGLLEHQIQLLVLAPLELLVLLRRRLGAVDSLRTWPGFWVGVRVGVGARARARLILGLGSARVRLAQSQLPHRAKPRHCASRAGASAPWRS